jgi:hypothetical protein
MQPGLAGLAEAASQQTEQHLQQQTQQQFSQHPADSSSSSAPLPDAQAQAAAGAVVNSINGSAPATGGTGSTNSVSLTGGAVNERLLEQWHAAYGSLVVDAVDLGIPRSVIPSVKADASPAQLQKAVQHLQDMMASFMSAGL